MLSIRFMAMTLFLALTLGGFAAYVLWLRPAASAQRPSPDLSQRRLGAPVMAADARTVRIRTPAEKGRLRPLHITDILPEALVIPALTGQTKEVVLRELAGHLAAQHADVDADQLVAVLLKRERLGSTAIGDGIAIPHGTLAGVKNLVAAFGRHVEGVDFGWPDGQPTRLFLLLVAPEDCAGLHLAALARMSLLLKDPAFRDQLVSAVEGRDLYEAIRREDGKY